MAAIPSTFARLQASSPARSMQPGQPAAPATQRLQFPSPPPALSTASLFSIPKEPEDARLTGGTRSLDRRLLALNLQFAKPRPARAVSAPQRMVTPLRPSAA
jgi:hypothetical protein